MVKRVPVFVFVFGYTKYAVGAGPKIIIKTLFGVQFSKTNEKKIVQRANPTGKRIAVAADAGGGKGSFSFFKKIAFKKGEEKYVFVPGRKESEGEKIISVLGIDGNVHLPVFRNGAEVQLFKQAHIVQFVLRFFKQAGGKEVPFFKRKFTRYHRGVYAGGGNMYVAYGLGLCL